MAVRSPTVLFVLASVPLSVGLSYALLRTTVRPAVLPPATSPGIHELAARVDELEGEARRRSLHPALLSAGSTVPRAPVVDGGPREGEASELEERLAALERRFSALELLAAGGALAADPGGGLEPGESFVRSAQMTLSDPAASKEEKVAAHQALRRVPDAYTPEMVDDLAHIGLDDPDPNVRADVWKNFDGSSTLPGLVPHLLRALRSDPNPGPRNEASETLGRYIEDPAVLQALQHAAEHDTSPHVRRKAKRTLLDWEWIVQDG